jgi:hypothetical protein
MTSSGGEERVGSGEGVVRVLGVVKDSSEGNGARGGTWRYCRTKRSCKKLEHVVEGCTRRMATRAVERRSKIPIWRESAMVVTARADLATW